MIRDDTPGIRTVEWHPHEILRRNAFEPNRRIGLEPEPPIVPRVSQNDASRCAMRPEGLQSRADQGSADPPPSQVAPNGDRAEAEPAACGSVDSDGRERDVSNEFAIADGDERDLQRARHPERIDDGRLVAIAVPGACEGVGRQAADGFVVGGSLGTYAVIQDGPPCARKAVRDACDGSRGEDTISSARCVGPCEPIRLTRASASRSISTG